MAVRWVAPIGLALIVLAGCGAKSSAALTKEGYASRADAICGKYNEKIKTFAKPKSLSGLAVIADKTLPVLDSAISEIGKLKPPASEKALSDQWLTQVRNLRNDLKDIRGKAKAGDMQGVQAVVPRATEHNSRSNALATQLGMSVCNKD